MSRYMRKKHIPIIFALICMSSTILLFVQAKETITQKQTEIHLEVNSELDRNVHLYLDGVKQAKKAIWHVDEVQMDTVGVYPGSIVYKDVEYPITFYIEDTTKPVIDLAKNHFTFYVGTPLKEINDRIHQEIQIHDNYDHVFEPIQVVTEDVDQPVETTYTFRIKDTQGNESEEVMIYVAFIDQEDRNTSSDVSSTPFPPIQTPSQSNKEEQIPPIQEDRKEDEDVSNMNRDVVYEEKLESWNAALSKADELTGWLDSPYAGYKYMIVPAQSGAVTLLILKE